MQDCLNELIDERNEKLYSIVNSEFGVNILPSFEPNYLSKLDENGFNIFIQEDKLLPEFFTHELLHGYLYTKNRYISRDFNLKVEQAQSSVSNIISYRLGEHIGNCLEHSKMLKVYLDLGYSNHLFISDYNIKKCNDRELNDISAGFTKNYIASYSVDLYLGKFFGMKFCNNKFNNYSKYYSHLEKIDKALFNLLNAFVSDWSTFDIDNDEDSYDEIFDYFIDDITDWSNKKRQPII